MSRDSLQTVTLPIIVQAGDSKQSDGWWGVYPRRGGASLTSVRVVSPEEITLNWRKILRGKDRDLFEGLDGLVRAYEARDEWELLDAADKLRPSIPTIPGITTQEDWTGDKIWGGARWEYSHLMTTTLQDAKLVMWWTEKGRQPFSPAIFCPDLKTAAFAMRFAGGIRVCPKCKSPFVPPSENVEYCKPSHGVAYRTARSRRKAKRLAEVAPKTKKKATAR